MKKSLLLLSLTAILGLTACGTTDPSGNTSGNSSPTPTQPTISEPGPSGPATIPTITINEDSDYDSRILEWSKKDHLYIHYTRGNDSKISDYDPYAFWIWEASPKSGSGGIFGNTNVIESPLYLRSTFPE